MNRTMLLALLSAAVAIGVWLLVTSSDGPSPLAVPEEPVSATGSDPDAPGDVSAVDSDHQPREERDAVSAVGETSATSSEPSLVVITGQCVDSAGKPLGGFDVSLRAGGKDWESWRRNRRVEADSKGRFRFEVLPGPDTAFVQIAAARRVEVQTAPFTMERDVELGMICIPAGFAVRGAVVDRSGRPRAGVKVALMKRKRLRDRSIAAVRPTATTDAYGRFDLGRCPRGGYFVTLDGALLVGPHRLDLIADVPSLNLLVEDRDSLPSISGVVLDAQGNPVARATVLAQEQSLYRYYGESAADGTFTIVRNRAGLRGEPRPVDLRCVAPGFDLSETVTDVEWGRNDTRLVVPPLGAIRLEVVDRETGKPVEDFIVRWRHRQGSPLLPVLPGKPASKVLETNHTDGVVRLLGLHANEYELHVQPIGSEFAAAHVEVELATGASVTKRCALHRSVQRIVQIEDARGVPVSSCSVQLCERWTSDVTLDSDCVSRDRLTVAANSSVCLLVDSGVSDSKGELLLRGPVATPLTIRVTGSHCAPCVRQIEEFEGDGPIRVAVAVSGRVELTTNVPDIARQLILEASSREDTYFGVRLYRETDGKREYVPPTGPPVPFSRLGRATLTVSEGSWTPVLVHPFGFHDMPSVYVRAGATSKVDVNIEPLRPATLRGQILPPPGSDGWRQVTVERWDPTASRNGRWHSSAVEVGPDGSFQHRGRGGRHRVVLHDLGRTVVLPPGEFDLAPGHVVNRRFVEESAQVEIALVDEAKQVVGQVKGLRLSRANGEVFARFGSDRAGKAVLQSCETGVFQLSVLPRRLGSRDAQVELVRKKRDYSALERERIPLGEVVVSASGANLVIQLPRAYFD